MNQFIIIFTFNQSTVTTVAVEATITTENDLLILQIFVHNKKISMLLSLKQGHGKTSVVPLFAPLTLSLKKKKSLHYLALPLLVVLMITNAPKTPPKRPKFPKTLTTQPLLIIVIPYIII